MKNKKVVLGVLIILLAFLIPMTILATIYNVKNNKYSDNPDYEMYYKGKIWFYNRENTLLSTYECLTEKCDLTKTIIDDDTYNINYYKDGQEENVPVVNYSYTFITDGDSTSLFDIKKGTKLLDYNSIKNYNTSIYGDYFIVSNTSKKWGVISLLDSPSIVIPFDYDFIGLKNNIKDNKLDASVFIVLKDKEWFLVNNEQEVLTKAYNNPIVDYTNEYIITRNSNSYEIYNYNNEEYLDREVIDNYYIVDKYIGLVINNNLRIYDNITNRPIKTIRLESEYDIKFEINDNKLNIINNNSVLDSIDI